jgi:hypothetical protein
MAGARASLREGMRGSARHALHEAQDRHLDMVPSQIGEGLLPRRPAGVADLDTHAFSLQTNGSGIPELAGQRFGRLQAARRGDQIGDTPEFARQQTRRPGWLQTKPVQGR